MTTEYIQDMAIVIDMDALITAVRDLGAAQLDVSRLLAHFQRDAGVRRRLRRIHAVIGAERLADPLRDALSMAKVDIHFSNKGRPDCLIFQHAHRMAEICDVLALLVSNSGYLPLLRHVKDLGCRVELHALPNSDPALFSAADEVVGLLPPTVKVQAAGVRPPSFGTPLAA